VVEWGGMGECKRKRLEIAVMESRYVVEWVLVVEERIE
jgi:hypothetical protein